MYTYLDIIPRELKLIIDSYVLYNKIIVNILNLYKDTVYLEISYESNTIKFFITLDDITKYINYINADIRMAQFISTYFPDPIIMIIKLKLDIMYKLLISNKVSIIYDYDYDCKVGYSTIIDKINNNLNIS